MNEANKDQETRRMGRHMLLLGWAIGLAFLVYVFSGILDRQHNPNQSIQSSTNARGMTEVELLRNRMGHYVANGYINDQPVVFLLDTGATVVSIPAGVADKLGLKAGAPSYANTANGMIKTFSTRLDSIGVGKIRLRNINAHINPHMDGEQILLGMSFLKRLELTQKGDTLTLRQARP